ncbi:MAG: tetratricopeptide repeat protein [bacterium]|nr:tetratricopeptide repeat protein [bacterium]
MMNADDSDTYRSLNAKLRAPRTMQTKRTVRTLKLICGLTACLLPGGLFAQTSDAKKLMVREKFVEAAESYRAECMRQSAVACWSGLGAALMGQKAHPQAVVAFERALQTAGTAAPARTRAALHANLGLAYLYDRRQVQAEQQYQQALKLDQNCVPALTNYGIYWIKAGQYERGKKLLLRVLKIEPDYFFAYLFLGYAQYRAGNLESALALMDRARKLNAGSFELYYYRAQVRYKTRDPGGALADLDRADRIRPGNALTGELRRKIMREHLR